MSRRLTSLTITLLCLGVLAAAFAMPAAAAPWQLTTDPLPAGVAAHDLSVFGASGLAVAGDAGSAAVSTDGGETWTRSTVEGGPSLSAIAFTSGTHGVAVGAGGLLLVTDDAGTTWKAATVQGGPLAADLLDVALAGSTGYAVGKGGLILATTDGGANWRTASSPTTADLTHVAAASGKAVAGGAGGVIVASSSGSWTKVANADGDITDAVLHPSTGGVTAYVATASTVLASTDMTHFTAAFWPGIYQVFQTTSADLMDLPAPVLVLGSHSSDLGLLTVADEAWTVVDTGAAATVVVRTMPGQGSAYVLAPEGDVLRTVSAGREPLAVKASSGVVTYGSEVTVTGTSKVLAPGGLSLQRRLVGGSSWLTISSRSWPGTADGTLAATLDPASTADYRLVFSFGSSVAEATASVRVGVRPLITPAKKTFRLHRGSVYRLRGTVSPVLRGEKVQFWTDRGGSWHKVSLGGTVKLTEGKSYRSRAFGCPKRETYHLRVKIPSTSRHAVGRSPLITVRVV